MVGRLSQRLGRRTGLATGFLAGGIGAICVVLAALFNSIPLLFISMLVYGAGTATNLQARYAGTDLALPAQRAKTISMAMVFTTFGAVAGPNLVNVTGKFATSLAEVELKGQTGEKNHVREIKINKKGIIIGGSVMVLTQIVMIAIMTMTPVHMQHHGHDLSKVGLVIGIHVASMYLPSVITGILVDRFGYIRMAYASGFTLLLSGLLAAFAPGDSMALLTLALALLGLGWNFGLISKA